MLVKTWSFGDKVVHAGRPEWGVGVIASAVAEVQEGKPCQRLSIRFDRAGLKTISTAHADLRPASEMPLISAEPPKSDDPFAASSSGPQAKELMLKLPDAACDPFSTPRARMVATLALYRYSAEGGPLLDWACAQSGLKDPMTRFTRPELEELFRRFAQIRDEHLRKLAFEFKKTEPGLLAEMLRTAPRGAQQVLRRLDLGR